MAEIQVQTKKNTSSSMWPWILVGLVLIAALIYFLTRNNDEKNRSETMERNTTSYIQWTAPGAHAFQSAYLV